MLIHINYFIAVCVLVVVILIVETGAYRRVVKERDAFGAILELYVNKYGMQTFNVDGDVYKVE